MTPEEINAKMSEVIMLYQSAKNFKDIEMANNKAQGIFFYISHYDQNEILNLKRQRLVEIEGAK